MEKLKKLVPEKIQIVGHRVIITENEFNTIVDCVNKQSVIINQLVENIENINQALNNENTEITNLKTAVGKLASALQTYLED